MSCLKVITTFLFGLALVACTKEDLTQDSAISGSGFTGNESKVHNLIKSFGCPDSLIQDMGDHFVADGDMLFSKNMSFQLPQTGQAFAEQAIINSAYLVWRGAKQRSIRVYLHPDAREYSLALATAIGMWNNVPNSAIKFVPVNTSAADIVVEPGNLPANVGATAKAPQNGLPGSKITINEAVFNGIARGQASLQLLKQTEMLAHELGHTLGFVHTDWATDGAPGNFLNLPGTTTNDRASIMHSVVSSSVHRSSLSNQDKIALVKLYPLRPVNVSLRLMNPGSTLITWAGEPFHAFTHIQLEMHYKTNGRVVSRQTLNVPPGVRASIQRFPPNFRGGTIVVDARIKYADGSFSDWSSDELSVIDRIPL